MLMRTRERKTIITQQEKVKNETRQQMNNLFQRLCSIDPFCCLESIITYLRRADFIFAPGKPSWAKPTVLDTFSKSSTLPRKNWQQTASWSFSWSFSPATIDFQNSPSSDFYMARDLSRLRRPPDRFAAKKACPAR